MRRRSTDSGVKVYKEIAVSREDFIAVAARLFAIYLLLSIIKYIPSSVQFLAQDAGASWMALYATVLVVGLVVCALLWFFPLTVARKLLPVMREQRSEQALDASVAISIGLTLIGVWVMAYGLVDGVYWLTLIVRTRQMNPAYFEWMPEQIAGMFATAVQILIALWLIFGSTGIKRLIYRYRYGASQGAP